MTALLPELVSLLEQETALARELVCVLQADQQRVIRHDVEGLEQSNLQKEQIALGFQALEEARVRVTQQLAAEVGVPVDEARVSTLCARLGPESAPLERAAENLRAVVGSLRELIAVGRGFLEQSILGIRSLLGLIHSLRTGEPQTYDASGRMAASPPPPMAVRREV